MTGVKIGRSDLELPPLGFGGGPLGGLDPQLTDAMAAAVLDAAWSEGLRHFDTAPWYGNTQSEHRLGRFLREKPRRHFTLTTKVGRIYRRPDRDFAFEASPWHRRWPGGLPFVPQFDYSHDGIMRSYEDSLTRLGLTRVDGLAIHDLDLRHHTTPEAVAAGFAQLEAGGYRALRELKESGEISAIGAGINMPGLIPRFLKRFEIDYFILAMPYTLLDQDAVREELPLCRQHGSSVIIGAPFASGILATGAVAGARYGYRPASQAVLDSVARIERICDAHHVSLAAAALQFPLAHPVVAATIPGAETVDQVRANAASFREVIPAGFWRDLVEEDLLADGVPVPGDDGACGPTG